jgi:hypothetical protein
MGAEGVGHDHFRPGVHVIAVNLFDEMGGIEKRHGAPDRRVRVDAAMLELGAGGAVEQDGTGIGETL